MKRFAQDMGSGWRVMDLDTDTVIRDVEWVDEETGEYLQAVRDADGKIPLVQDAAGRQVILAERKRGNVRLVRVDAPVA